MGVDRSEAFLSWARASSVTGEEYVAADVAAVPLRIRSIGAQPDLIYARLLASHLPEPEQAISGWASELEAGGLLLVEEPRCLRSAGEDVRVYRAKDDVWR